MNARPTTQAETTAAILQDAAHNGAPVLIPGALEVRVGHPDTRVRTSALHAVVRREYPGTVTGRERIALELEGGGAPSQRRPAGLRIHPPASGLVPEGTAMPYPYKPLAFVCLLVLGIFALSGSRVVMGFWLLLLVGVALAAPALILRRH